MKNLMIMEASASRRTDSRMRGSRPEKRFLSDCLSPYVGRADNCMTCRKTERFSVKNNASFMYWTRVLCAETGTLKLMDSSSI